MGRPRIRIEGQKFGQLKVLHRVKDRKAGSGHFEIWYRCLCDCGELCSKRGYMLRHGRVSQCGHARGVIHGFSKTKEYSMWLTAKARAHEKNMVFTLQPSDIFIPTRCPLLGIKLALNNKKTSQDSPSIDRINSRKGYTQDNIWVVSQKANQIKSNASLTELKRLVLNLEKLWASSI
jgi:hypothetical protein